MISGHAKIIDCWRSKRIHIEPFDLNMVGPNSYDVHLGAKIKRVLPNTTVDGYPCIDLRLPSKNVEHDLLAGDLIIFPGQLWLGITIEEIGSDHYVPHMHGCSTNGRSGLVPHVEAGAGDVGFKHKWTLEIMAMAEPIVLYYGMRIAQIEFNEVSDNNWLYGRDCGRYAVQNEPTGGK